MFLLLPLVIIIVSLLGIAIIIWRKKSYLKKLYALNMAGNGGSGELNPSNLRWGNYGFEFFPEIKVLLDKFEFHKHRTVWLMETEKMLRKLRVMFLRVDRWSDTLIKKIRRVNLNGQLNSQTMNKPIESYEEAISPDGNIGQAKKETVSFNFLKNEEQRLILEIAKNPKDSQLYESLGDLYFEMESFSDAKESYEAAIELNPQNESLKIKLSSALEKLSGQP